MYMYMYIYIHIYVAKPLGSRATNLSQHLWLESQETTNATSGFDLQESIVGVKHVFRIRNCGAFSAAEMKADPTRYLKIELTQKRTPRVYQSKRPLLDPPPRSCTY